MIWMQVAGRQTLTGLDVTKGRSLDKLLKENKLVSRTIVGASELPGMF